MIFQIEQIDSLNIINMKAIMNIDDNILTVNINFFVLPKAAIAAHTMAKQFIATLKG